MNEPTLFTKIIRGDVPSHRLYEDERTFVFLNIFPSMPGHLLVVPKTQEARLENLSDDDYSAVMTTTKKMMKRVCEVLGVKYACLKVEGFEVPHAHVHVIPCNESQDFNQPDHNRTTEPDHDALAVMAKRLSL